MNNARDELAGLLFTTDNSKSVSPWSEWERCKDDPRLAGYVYALADAILAAGYVRPEQVTEYGIAFNRSAVFLTPPAHSLEEFKERYPREHGWMLSPRDIYLIRTYKRVEPEVSSASVLYEPEGK